jgi:hypothetical protein
MAVALSVALELLGAVLPIAMFIAPAAASFLVATVCVECGRKMALMAYVAVSLLGLVLVPDKEVALIYTVLLGYYPLVKPYLDRLRLALLRVGAKLLLCNGAVLSMYGVLLLLFPVAEVSQELKQAAWAMAAVTLLLGNIAFLLYDRALVNLLRVYARVWRPRLHRMIGRG